jgi:preprotein translocase subunit SecD
MNRLNYRVIIFLFAFLFGIIFSIQSLIQSEEGKKITLGLDLQGGLHMLLSVKSEVAVESKVKSIGTTIKYELEKEDIIFDDLKIEDNSVKFELLDKDDLPKVSELLKSDFSDIEAKQDGLKFILTLSKKLIEETKKRCHKSSS